MKAGRLLKVLSTICAICHHRCLASRSNLLAHIIRDQQKAAEANRPEDEEQKPLYELPAAYVPWPDSDPDTLLPEFPMTHQFATSIDMNPEALVHLSGHLNIPFVKQNKIWDLHGVAETHQNSVMFQHAHQVSPVNMLHLPMDEVQRQLPSLQQQAASLPRRQMLSLPSDDGVFYPSIMCRPPMCNPYVHSFNMRAFTNGGGDDFAKLDFPIFSDKPGEPDTRFPLSGATSYGAGAVAWEYGHHLAPIDPFKDAQRGGSLSSQMIPFPDLSGFRSPPTLRRIRRSFPFYSLMY